MDINMEYYIISGKMKILKTTFAQEILRPNSVLRKLLKWKSTRDFINKHPIISTPDNDGFIVIDFSKAGDIKTEESPRDIFSSLKSRHRGNIKGKVACKAIYKSEYGSVYFFKLDLNSKNEKVDYDYI